MWAVKKPGAAWLEASDDWSFWYDFDQSLLEDRLAADIRLVDDPKSNPEQKIEALKRLQGSWSRNLRDLYHRLLLNPAASPADKHTALSHLRRKPSKETAGVIVELLSNTRDEELRQMATQVLRTQNPKGPLYNPTGSAMERSNAVEYWNNWWKSQNAK